MLKFATEDQNIPWRKILEFGCRVFDKTRTPVDLKDKWRKITSKQGKITKIQLIFIISEFLGYISLFLVLYCIVCPGNFGFSAMR